MARIKPIPREELAEFEPFFQQFEQMGGFVPNSLLTMAHQPEILKGYMAMGRGVMMHGTVDRRLKQLVGLVASTASGCLYCQAHMTTFSGLLGVSAEQLGKVWQFEWNDEFNNAEKAALRLAQGGGQVPNGVTDEHFEDLKKYYTDAEIVELVGVIAMFGFLNRWNDTMATILEDKPLDFATQHIGKHGWVVGKHDKFVD